MDLASMVLPTPGTSSISRCPSATRHTRASRTSCSLPWMTCMTLSAMLANAEANFSQSAASLRATTAPPSSLCDTSQRSSYTNSRRRTVGLGFPGDGRPRRKSPVAAKGETHARPQRQDAPRGPYLLGRARARDGPGTGVFGRMQEAHAIPRVKLHACKPGESSKGARFQVAARLKRIGMKSVTIQDFHMRSPTGLRLSLAPDSTWGVVILARVPIVGRSLVLNATQQPLAVVPARRAVVLVLKEKADVVASNGILFRSERLEVPAPSVVRLRYFVHVPYPAQAALTRRAVFARDGWTCQYCGS